MFPVSLRLKNEKGTLYKRSTSKLTVLLELRCAGTSFIGLSKAFRYSHQKFCFASFDTFDFY